MKARQLVSFVYLCGAGLYALLRDLWQRARWRSEGVRMSRGVVIRAHSAGAIHIGQGSCVGLGTLLIATSEMSVLPVEVSRLRIGAGTAINEYCNIRASGGEIVIGDKCLLAQMVTIVASNHSTSVGTPMIEQKWSTAPHSVHIGNDVWIGAGVTVLPGAHIGNGAVIGAGAVVRGVVPAGEIWGGVPARRISIRQAGETA